MPGGTPQTTFILSVKSLTGIFTITIKIIEN